MDMRNKLNFMCWTIEINLILWLVAIGCVLTEQDYNLLRLIAIAGFALTALLQHWAYYYLRKAN